MEPMTPESSRRVKPQELDLTEVHHPNCPYGRMSVRQRRRALETSTPHLPAETSKAIEAVRFVSAHLKNEDDFGEVRNVKDDRLNGSNVRGCGLQCMASIPILSWRT